MRPLVCWDHVFEFCSGYGNSSLVCVVCCTGSGICDEVITRSEESDRVSVCVCLIVCDVCSPKARHLCTVCVIASQRNETLLTCWEFL